MIILVTASAISLLASQASIAAPTDAFRGCLRDASAKASTEKVGGDAIEAYLKGACTVQMGSLKSALVAFRVKNGMSRKAALDDAEMTVDDYLATPVDKYKFMIDYNAPKQPASTPAPTPASQAKPATPQEPKL